jgi:light-independent protochlorophyllide reductase B subunit
MGEYGQAGPKISISTCAPEIIGDNLNDVVARINPKLPVVAVSGGFQGNQYYGLNETLLRLVMKFADPSPVTERGLVNLIGSIGGTLQWRADVREMDRLLTALGLTVNYLVCDSTLDNVRRASRAEATILIGPEIGAPAAEYLQRSFKLQVIASAFGLPLGLRGTEAWLRAVSAALGLDAGRLDAVLEREEEETRFALKVGLNNLVFSEKTMRLKRLPVAVVAEAVSALSWARFLAEELEMRPCVVGLRTPMKKYDLHPDLTQWLNASDDCAILAEPSVDSVQRALEKFQPHLVLGSSLEADMVRDLGLPAFVHVAHPNTQYVNIVEKPHLGYNGMLNICETILNVI